MSDDLVNAGLRIIDAVNAGDVEAALEHIHPDIEFVPMRAAVQGAFHGHDGIREFFHDNAENFELFEMTLSEVHDMGDQVVAIGSVRVRGKGGGVEATRPSAFVAEFQDGRAIRMRDFGDGRAALDAARWAE